jgi:hypothetical protein
MSATTLILEEETAQGLQQGADELGLNAADLAERAIRRYLRQEAERKIEEEEDHYRAQLAELLAVYEDRYIAMHNGQVVDSDTDEMALYLRIRRTYPLMGILIKRVTSDPDIIWHMRSPRLEHR